MRRTPLFHKSVNTIERELRTRTSGRVDAECNTARTSFTRCATTLRNYTFAFPTAV